MEKQNAVTATLKAEQQATIETLNYRQVIQALTLAHLNYHSVKPEDQPALDAAIEALEARRDAINAPGRKGGAR